MSRNGSKFSLRRRIMTATLGLLALGAAIGGGFLAFGGNDVSANYSSTADVTASADGGTLDLKSTSSISFQKLIPGRPQSQTISFNNEGNVAGDSLTINLPTTASATVPTGQNPDWNQVYVSVPGYLNPTPITSVTTVNIGSIGAKGSTTATRTVTVTLELRSAGNNPAGDAKDNMFQGVVVSGVLTGKARTS